MKFSQTKYGIILFFLICILSTSGAQVLPEFENGDKVCFIGNSITQDGRYQAFIQLYYATRFPNIKIEYYNCGVSGDVADRMLARFEEDILLHQPDYAFLMTGMNDVAHNLYSDEYPDAAILLRRQKALDNYYIKTEKLTQLLIKNKIQPILLTPTIYDETAKLKRPRGYGINKGLASCAEHIRNMAKKYNLQVVDLFRITNEINLKVQEDNPTNTIIGKDRVHPSTTGHFIMAYEIINTIKPLKYVSNIGLDARKGKIMYAENCSIKLEEQSKNFTFKVLENALPFPVKEELEEAEKLVQFNAKLNNEMLSVKRLSKGKYNLMIDEQIVGVYSSKDLKTGINLSANQKTPQFIQAELVSALVFNYRKVQNKLRSISYVEYGMLNEYTGANTEQAKKEYLNIELEKIKGKRSYKYKGKMVNRYFENLPREKALWEELSKVRDELFISNNPQWHVYSLIKM